MHNRRVAQDWTTGLGAHTPDADNGLGYQHCLTPTGPCTVSDVPVNRMADNPTIAPGYGNDFDIIWGHLARLAGPQLYATPHAPCDEYAIYI